MKRSRVYSYPLWYLEMLSYDIYKIGDKELSSGLYRLVVLRRRINEELDKYRCKGYINMNRVYSDYEVFKTTFKDQDELKCHVRKVLEIENNRTKRLEMYVISKKVEEKNFLDSKIFE